MFTGIIECMGRVVSTTRQDGNLVLRIESPISAELQVGQSVNHNGVCLTVTTVAETQHEVTAIQETLERSNLGSLRTGDQVNLERAMPISGRFDGHIVQGHVDDTLECLSSESRDGSTRFFFPLNTALVIHKGSVCLNGVSLTVSSLRDTEFSVDIIPLTSRITTFGSLQAGDRLNVEYDVIGKYVQKLVR
jgi:riboflavin synthase